LDSDFGGFEIKHTGDLAITHDGSIELTR